MPVAEGEEDILLVIDVVEVTVGVMVNVTVAPADMLLRADALVLAVVVILGLLDDEPDEVGAEDTVGFDDLDAIEVGVDTLVPDGDAVVETDADPVLERV